MNLSKEITIVVPCKNEGLVIRKTLELIDLLEDIKNVNVIVADCSDDDLFTKKCILSPKKKNIKITLIEGGFPAQARNNGAKLVNTPYVLFLDADIFIKNLSLLNHMVSIMKKMDYHLSTTRIRTDDGHYNYIYKLYELIQYLSKFSSPFTVGGFMLFNTKAFNLLNGFNDMDRFAEDYHLSSKINPKKFYIDKHEVYTTSRRFKKKGLYYMIIMMVRSWLNRNNSQFFINEHNYWK